MKTSLIIVIPISGLLLFACSGGNTATGGSGSPTTAATTTAPAMVLQDENGAEPLSDLVAKQPFTVLLFFTAECPVQKAHDARTRDIVSAYASRGVAVIAVVSEVGTDMPATREDVKKRALTIPVLEDKNAALANALGVEYSTHAILIAQDRRILYSGAFDSDRVHLTDKSEPYLKNALDEALAGKPIAKAKTEALGCALRKR